MPRFNEFYYLNGTYGFRTNLEFSADPIVAIAVDYSTVAVSWSAPSGDYSDFRIVRSQRGFPQTQEDGVIISTIPSGSSEKDPYRDTTADETAPLVGGRFVFYRAWVRKSENSSWVPAGDAYTLLPSPHNLSVGRDAVYTAGSVAAAVGETTPITAQDALVYTDPNVNPFISSTHERFLDLFPRVITSTTNTALDVPENKYNKDVDPGGQKDNSLFSTFMSAFSFTLDEMFTFSNLITPDVNVHYSSPTAVFLGAHELGMTQDVDSVTATQRRLLRNAVEIYSKKGTSPGLELYLQSATGYDATLRDTVNLLLTYQDATFDLPFWEEDAAAAVTDGTDAPAIGGWRTLSSGLELEVDRLSGLGSEYDSSPVFKNVRSLDASYCLKVTPSEASQKIALGIFDPVNYGIPVTEGDSYAFSFWAKLAASGSATISAAVTWFDKRGLKLSETAVGSAKSVNTSSYAAFTTGLSTSFKQQYLGVSTAPSKAVYAGITLTFSDDVIFYLDRVQFQKTGIISAVTLSDPSGGGEYVCNNTFKNGDRVLTQKGSRLGISVVSWATETTLRLVEYVTTAADPEASPIEADSFVYLMDYEEPRGVVALLAPSAVNRVSNPTLFVNAADWSSYNTSSFARQNNQGRSGIGYVKAISDGAHPLIVSPALEPISEIAMQTGSYYSASCYVKDNGTGSKYRIITRFMYGGSDIREYSSAGVLLTEESLYFNTGGGVTVDVSPHSVGPETEVSSSGWTRVSHSVKVPPVSSPCGTIAVSGNVATVTVSEPVYAASVSLSGFTDDLEIFNGAWAVEEYGEDNLSFTFKVIADDMVATTPSGAIVKHHETDLNALFYIVSVDTPSSGAAALYDAAQFEDSSIPSDYFDGSITDDGNVWHDTDHSSTSGKFPAREPRVNRVREEIAEYLPYDTPYYVDLFSSGYLSDNRNQISGIS